VSRVAEESTAVLPSGGYLQLAMSRNKGRPPLSTGPVPAILVPPPSSLVDSPTPGSIPDLTIGGGAIPIPLGPPPVPHTQGRMSYRSEDDYPTDDALPAVSQRRTGDFVQRDPERYRPEYGPSARTTPQLADKKRNRPRNSAVTDRLYGDDDTNNLRAKNRSLKMELEDHVGRLELLKTDNDNLIQRLGDARKERERMEQEIERERREFREKLREFEKARGDWKVCLIIIVCSCTVCCGTNMSVEVLSTLKLNSDF
jgi:hypothetical protein